MQAKKSIPVYHLVVMGVSGCGKTTVAGIIADRYGLEVAEADDFHPQANVDKMASGHPLTDEDRWPWLADLRSWMTAKAKEGKSTVLTCSALRRSYRDILRDGDDRVIFVHLDGDKEIIKRRMSARIGHFMPAKLLESQLETLEDLDPDEIGFVVDIDATPQEIASNVMKEFEKEREKQGWAEPFASASPQKSADEPATATSDSSKTPADDTSSERHPEKADLGVYGLGVMGTSLARNFAHKGFRVAVYNFETQVTDDFMERYGDEGKFIATKSEKEFADSLATPRVALLMVTAGEVTDMVTNQVADVFEEGDIIVDMGNSHFPDTRRREAAMRERGLHFVGCGTSGGQEGALRGPALMVGGSQESFERMSPMFNAIAAKAGDGKPCCAHVGTDGAGHFVKMIHNGIEYADMQLISEAYSLLRYAAGLEPSEIAEVFAAWNEGELNSYLMECSAQILAHTDAETGKPFIDVIDDRAGQKGTGLWTVKESLDLGVPLTGIAEATLARMLSGSVSGRSVAQDVFGGAAFLPPITDEHEREHFVSAVRDALYASKIVAYSQGFDAIQAGAKRYGWTMDYVRIAEVWRAGCIIRAKFLEHIAAAYRDNPDLELLMAAPQFAPLVTKAQAGWRKVVEAAVHRAIPIPAFSTSVAYFDALHQPRLATSLVQAQRDFFGAHTYRRIDKDGVFHTLWAGDKSEEKLSE